MRGNLNLVFPLHNSILVTGRYEQHQFVNWSVQFSWGALSFTLTVQESICYAYSDLSYTPIIARIDLYDACERPMTSCIFVLLGDNDIPYREISLGVVPLWSRL